MKRSCVVLQKGVIAQGEKENGSDKDHQSPPIVFRFGSKKLKNGLIYKCPTVLGHRHQFRSYIESVHR